MPVNLRGRSFLTLKDFSTKEILYLINLSKDLKSKYRAGIKGELLSDKNVVLIFDKPSTRTRCAFEMAASQEGAYVTYLTNSQMGKKESVEDTAEVLGRYYDGIEYRGFKQSLIEDLAIHSHVPVWNGLTDEFHPTQILADLLTIQEKIFKPYENIKVVFVGDARNNMGNSWMIGCAKLGMHFVGLGPKSLWPKPSLVKQMQEIAKDTGAKIEITSNIDKAVKDADIIYTDVWVSMGEEGKYAERIKLLKPYQVNMKMLKKARNKHIRFMHCLPSFHNLKTEVGRQIYKKFGLKELEVTDEVFRSHHSIVFDEAENRLHTIKAVMVATIGNI
ncbi:MAG: Ornithine carbamoyltransferase [Candidatus Anoxychlamydiales bacterium]|nr:Ornithine carbamoyltransferase [Candidatus Anoxychlamydiales bacterium]NGX36651.1 Ornithine carbamoyltransferase [Candidatus Anoxychlamydiales bacterium]